ncbi:hypothetical protein IFR05_015871 [Cadophora sp. M221]|nr:hypothetical protein IFR05_015871 [Cadophora sp. M221]
MADVDKASPILGIISSVISIIDATDEVYGDVEDEAGLPKVFNNVAFKLPFISYLFQDVERYIEKTSENSIFALTPTLEDCKVQATKVQQLFEKVMPENGDSRWDRYVNAAQTIGKDAHVERLIGRMLDDLRRLTDFPQVTTSRRKERLAEAIKEVSRMEPSLPHGEVPAFANYENSCTVLYCKRSRPDSTALSVYQRLSSVEKSFIEKHTSEMRKSASLQACQGATTTDEEILKLRKQLILFAIAKTLEVNDQKEPYMLWTRMCDGIQYPQICGNVWFNVPTIFPSITDGSGHSYASVGHRTSQLCQRHQGSTKIDFSYPQISLRCPLLVWTEVLAENAKSRLSSQYSDGLPSIWPGEDVRENAGLRGPLFANCVMQILILLSNLLDPRSCSGLIKELLKSDYAQAKEYMGSENVSKKEMWDVYFEIWLKGLGIGKPKRLTSWEDYDLESGISIAGR